MDIRPAAHARLSVYLDIFAQLFWLSWYAHSCLAWKVSIANQSLERGFIWRGVFKLRWTTLEKNRLCTFEVIIYELNSNSTHTGFVFTLLVMILYFKDFVLLFVHYEIDLEPTTLTDNSFLAKFSNLLLRLSSISFPIHYPDTESFYSIKNKQHSNESINIYFISWIQWTAIVWD